MRKTLILSTAFGVLTLPIFGVGGGGRGTASMAKYEVANPAPVGATAAAPAGAGQAYPDCRGA